MENNFSDYIQQHKSELESDLLAMVAIESVEAPAAPGQPFGEKVAKALDTIVKIGQKLGFVCQNHNGYYATIDYGEIAEPYQAVGVLCHADVVPLGEGWNYNPLGQVADSRIYGRGTLDDKGPAIASLYGLAALKAAKIPLSRPIRLVIGGNEETHSRCMQQYNKENIPLWGGFSPDGDFPVIFAEKGIAMHRGSYAIPSAVIESITAGTAVNAVPGKAEAVLRIDDHTALDEILAAYPEAAKIGVSIITTEAATPRLKITAVGKSAHGSTPERGESAVKLLLEVLGQLKIKDELLEKLRNIYHLFCCDHWGEAAGIAAADDVSGRLTLNLGILNYTDGQLEIELDMRYPVTLAYDPIKAGLDNAMAAVRLPISCVEHKKPLYVAKDSELVCTLADIYRRTGRTDTEPLAIGGGTYCRTMKNFVAFGPIGKDDEDTMHQADEYIEREHLLFLTEIYAQAMYQLAK